ncbi:MAG TPA: outer membrane beta-barrel protein [Vicinamibacterales bacterium]|nr:outer membrane beta-barrel protein [Vicinamibacterales bacterium]
MKIITAGLLCLGMCAAATPAQAQMTWTDKGFFNVSAGIQSGSQDLSRTTPLNIFGETGSVASTLDIKSGGFFDVGAGFKVWRNLALGVSYSWTDAKSDATIAAVVPDPLFFDRPRNVAGSAPDFKHQEQAIHFSGTWMVPVTDKIDVALAFGPTYFSVKQDLPINITLAEPGPSITSVGVESLDESTVGFHVGLDVSYMVTRRVGVGGMARYAGASFDVENASDKLKVGGLQIGGGVRIRF